MKTMPGNLLPIGFEKHEISTLEALLTLGTPRLKRPWRLGGCIDSSYVLAKVDASEASQARWRELVRELDPECLIALTKPEINIPARRRIQVRGSLPGLRDLVETLNTLGNRSGQAIPEISPPLAPDAADRFDPGRHFISLVEEACEQPSNVYLEYRHLGIYCCPEQRAFYSLKPLEDLLPLVKAEPSEITQKTIHPMPDLDQLKAEGWKRYDLLELRWFATLVSSQGRLHGEIDPAEPLHLGTSPNWIRLPYYSEYATVAGFMATAAEPIAKIAEAAGCAETEVADFVNACHALKLLVRGREALDVCTVQRAARQRIASLCGQFSEKTSQDQIKLVFTGSIGAGKTTAIGRLSDHLVMLTETRSSDATQLRKGTTTVAMDYGHFICPNGSKIHLYGTPGQRRFDFMGQILARNASAIVIFIRNIEDDPLGELEYYINQYRHSAAKIVVAVTHSDLTETPVVSDYERALEAEGLALPVVAADPRNPSGLVEVFERLL
jgi:signal recognition particle receptor subunit beta